MSGIIKHKSKGLSSKSIYWLVVISLVCVYFLSEIFVDSERYTDIITNVIAIAVGGTFWVEYRRNKLESQEKNKSTETQFIIELNNQFVTNEHLMDVEHELEKFYYFHKHGTLTEEHKKHFLELYDITSRERQKLVSYLVHLEGIATLINNNAINLNAITDLMAYRYFVAVNNPIVQKLELTAYPQYYKGCYKLYNRWYDYFNKSEIPLNEFPLVDTQGNSNKVEI